MNLNYLQFNVGFAHAQHHLRPCRCLNRFVTIFAFFVGLGGKKERYSNMNAILIDDVGRRYEYSHVNQLVSPADD